MTTPSSTGPVKQKLNNAYYCKIKIPFERLDTENSFIKKMFYFCFRLFKKSGVHSALKHDVIMDGDGGADFALIDAEAERVAKEAVQRLRDSRRACFRASDGIPTWTGTEFSAASCNP